MSDFLDRISKLSPQRLALLAVQLNANLEQLKLQASEPLAIIGLGCRLPGGIVDADSYWRVLDEGRDVISEIPADRFDVDAYYDPDPDAPGKMSTRWGGFIANIDQFDPEFFGISPREAAGMDPQQRLLLEVAWEALENAGQNPERLAGSRTGVFAGLCNSDYYQLRLAGGQGSIDAYVATGNAHSVASGRISYLLGLQGPSVSIDTACSSSLVAIHQACQSLRTRECNLALAGGVNLILLPDTTITLSKSHMMSPEGRCKAFDASANGFVRSEGCGLVVLKRLSEARNDGDRILAVIRGSACNQDGASSGLTAPNGPSQVAVIRDALANAGLQPGDIDYIEAHGTGTSLGDPIEARSLAEVFAPERPADHPLQVGSVKSNMGHAESAAGIAGLIKVVLALHRGRIPPSLHLQKLNPHIDWKGLPLQVSTTLTDWQHPKGARAAGVSSFGFSGTNAHLILSDLPANEADPAATATSRMHLLPLSARTEPALVELARHYADSLRDRAQTELAAICHTAGAGRSHFEHRLAIRASSVPDLHEALAAVGRGEHPARTRQGWAGNATVPGVVFLFTGQGAQHPNMGRELFNSQPVFRRELERCAEILQPLLDRPLFDVLWSDDTQARTASRNAGLLDQTQYTQPALFAVEYALAALWRSWGIEPAAVLGHSVGEYVAACVAGVFSVEDGLRLIAERGRLMATLPAGGAMASVFADERTVAIAIRPDAARVAIACLNAPEHVVLSGERAAVQAILQRLEQGGIKSRALLVSHAFHSPLMDPILASFEQVAQSIRYAEPRTAIISNVTGAAAEPDLMTNAAYWRRHVRQAVRFTDSIRTLREAGQSIFLELGPHPVLTGLARQTATETNLVWATSLHRERGDWEALLEGAATLYTRGINFNWDGFQADSAPQRVSLPTYPFQRSRHWLEPVTVAVRSTRSRSAHPFLGERLDSPAFTSPVFELEMGIDRPPFLNDHRIFGRLIMPSPAFIEMALAGLTEIGGTAHADSVPCEISDLQIREPLFLPEKDSCRIQLIFEEVQSGGTGFRVCSRECSPRNASPWRTHVTGRARLGAVAEPARAAAWRRDDVLRRCPRETDAREFYDSLIALGLDFGDRFRGITRMWRGEGEALGELRLPEALARETAPYRIHPALLDTCFHLLGAALPASAPQQAYLLIGLDRFSLLQLPPARLWNHTVLRPTMDAKWEAFSGDIWLYDDDGRLVAEVRGLQLRRATGEALARAGGEGADDWFYEMQWRSQEITPASGANREAGLVADFIPDASTLADEVRPKLLTLAAAEKVSIYDELIPALESLSASFIIRAFARLGWSPHPGDHVTTSALADQLAIVPAQQRLFGRLLAILAEEGHLRRAGNGWTVLKVIEALASDPQADAAALQQRFPATTAEVKMTARCADRLDEVLRGTCDPLHLLFPNGDFGVADALYRRSPFARTLNTAARDAVLAALQGAPSGRKVRILEIGAGTGGTSSFVLPHLPPEQTRYTFTDVSPLFVARGQEEFRACTFAEFTVLDVEKEPSTQGFGGRTFDVIIAANVLHATRDMRETLRHTTSLLAPGGMLLLLEGTAPRRWVDLTFGMTDGWWRFTDASLRPDYALLSTEQWLGLLAETGLAAAQLTASTVPGSAVAQQSLLLARKPLMTAASEVAAGNSGYWIVLRDSGGVGDAVAAQLRARGEACVFITRGAGFARHADGTYALDPLDAPACKQLFVEIRAGSHGPLRGVLQLWPLDENVTEETTPEAWELAQSQVGAGVFQVFQALLAEPAPEGFPVPRFWLATRSAQSASAADGAGQPVQAIVWGLARVISLEQPARFGAVIDLERTTTPRDAADAIVAEIDGDGQEDAAAIRDGRRFVPRIARAKEPVAGARLDLRHDASYLVTGGLGGLGLRVARWMAERGAGNIVLLSRRAFPQRPDWLTLATDHAHHAAVQEILAMEKLGASVIVARGDVADEAGLSALFGRFGADLPPLRGVIHAAVDMSGRSVADLDLAAFRGMGRAKALGAWVLHRLTRDRELDFFVLFSSTTALWGVAGLAHYAAANQALDLLAHWRRARGLPALSINWGTWQEMRVASEAEKERFAQSGLQPMETDRALLALERLMVANRPSAIVAAVDWNALRAVYEARRPRPIFADVSTARTPVKSVAASEPDIMRKLRQASPARRRDHLVAHLRALAGAVLGFDARREMPLDQGLFDMGMDSLMSVELKGRLERSLGIPLPSTLTFNYPTLGALSDFLLNEALKFEPPAVIDAPTSATGSTAATGPTAAVAAAREDMSEDDLEQALINKLQGLK